MIKIDFSAKEIEELRQERFAYPHPIVQKKCEALLLKAYELPTSLIAKIMGNTENTVRNYIHDYQIGGINNLKVIRYLGQSTKLSMYTKTIEEEFRQNPPASILEAMHSIEKLTGIKRGLTQTRQFVKRIGLKFRKVAPVPGKVDPEQQEEFKKNNLNQGLLKPEIRSGWYFL